MLLMASPLSTKSAKKSLMALTTMDGWVAQLTQIFPQKQI